MGRPRSKYARPEGRGFDSTGVYAGQYQRGPAAARRGPADASVSGIDQPAMRTSGAPTAAMNSSDVEIRANISSIASSVAA